MATHHHTIKSKMVFPPQSVDQLKTALTLLDEVLKVNFPGGVTAAEMGKERFRKFDRLCDARQAIQSTLKD